MMTIRVAAVLLLFTCLLGSEPKRAEPRYAEGNQLMRPEGYRKWIFVGSSLGMGYTEGTAQRTANFHNIYIQPEAFQQFEATGKFPDKTMLVMEVIAPGTNASINRQGHFEDRFIGIETAVKDESRFPDKWAYFNFIREGGGALAQSKAFPKQACWKCHNEHGAADNVFVQFYPVLRDARATNK